MLGNDQPVILQLLEITPALGAVKGVVMELMIAHFRCKKQFIPMMPMLRSRMVTMRCWWARVPEARMERKDRWKPTPLSFRPVAG